MHAHIIIYVTYIIMYRTVYIITLPFIVHTYILVLIHWIIHSPIPCHMTNGTIVPPVALSSVPSTKHNNRSRSTTKQLRL